MRVSSSNREMTIFLGLGQTQAIFRLFYFFIPEYSWPEKESQARFFLWILQCILVGRSDSFDRNNDSFSRFKELRGIELFWEWSDSIFTIGKNLSKQSESDSVMSRNFLSKTTNPLRRIRFSPSLSSDPKEPILVLSYVKQHCCGKVHHWLKLRKDRLAWGNALVFAKRGLITKAIENLIIKEINWKDMEKFFIARFQVTL